MNFLLFLTTTWRLYFIVLVGVTFLFFLGSITTPNTSKTVDLNGKPKQGKKGQTYALVDTLSISAGLSQKEGDNRRRDRPNKTKTGTRAREEVVIGKIPKGRTQSH